MKARIKNTYKVPCNIEKIIPIGDDGLACIGWYRDDIYKKQLVILRDGATHLLKHSFQPLAAIENYSSSRLSKLEENGCALIKTEEGFALMNAERIDFFNDNGFKKSCAITEEPYIQKYDRSGSRLIAAPIRGCHVEDDKYLILLPNHAAGNASAPRHVGGGYMVRYLHIGQHPLRLVSPRKLLHPKFQYENSEWRIKSDEQSPQVFEGEEIIHSLVICDAIDLGGKIYFHTIGRFTPGYMGHTYSRFCSFNDDGSYDILKNFPQGFAKFSADKKYLIQKNYRKPKDLLFLDLDNGSESELHITPKKVLASVDKQFRLFDCYKNNLWLVCGESVTQLDISMT